MYYTGETTLDASGSFEKIQHNTFAIGSGDVIALSDVKSELITLDETSLNEIGLAQFSPSTSAHSAFSPVESKDQKIEPKSKKKKDSEKDIISTHKEILEELKLLRHLHAQQLKEMQKRNEIEQRKLELKLRKANNNA